MAETSNEMTITPIPWFSAQLQGERVENSGVNLSLRRETTFTLIFIASWPVI